MHPSDYLESIFFKEETSPAEATPSIQTDKVDAYVSAVKAANWEWRENKKNGKEQSVNDLDHMADRLWQKLDKKQRKLAEALL